MIKTTRGLMYNLRADGQQLNKSKEQEQAEAVLLEHISAIALSAGAFAVEVDYDLAGSSTASEQQAA